MKRTKQIWIIGTIVLALAVMGPLHAQGVFMIKSGSLTATSGSCTATACVSMPVNSATGSVGVQIAGSFSATVSFEGTVDGTNYAPVLALPAAGGTPASSATTTGIWQMTTIPYTTGVRARVSAFGSGPVVVTLSRSPVPVPAVNSVTLGPALAVSSLTSTGPVSGTTGTFSGAVASVADVSGISQTVTGANSQTVQILSLSEVTTIAASATSVTTMQIPAGAIVLGIPVRVTTVIPTASTFTVTGNTTSTVFDTAAVSVAANSTDAGTANCPFLNTTAQTIRITPNGTPAANTGRVRVTIFYILVTPPGS